MSDRFAAWIRIGGKLAGDHVPELLAAIECRCVSTEWGDGRFIPTDATELLGARKGRHLWLCDDQASNGEFPEIEETCQGLGLGYRRHGEAYLSCDAEIVDWRPGMKRPLWRPASNRGELPIVPLAGVQRALARLRKREVKEAQEILSRLCRSVPRLPPFRIV